MQYCAIIFVVDVDTGQTFSLSREVDTVDRQEIYDLLKDEAHATDDNIDTILVLANAYEGAPDVIRHWTALNGDFEGL